MAKNYWVCSTKNFIIEDTLKNNILFGLDKEKINENYFREVLLKSNLNQLISKLPQGVNTIIKEDGTTSSVEKYKELFREHYQESLKF